MKPNCQLVLIALLLGGAVTEAATAQRRGRAEARRNAPAEVEEPAPAPIAAEAESLASSLGVIIYPAGGQTPEQQLADEAECSTWARQQVPDQPAAAPSAPEPAETESARGRGSRNRSGLKGAAKGALIGEVLEDDEPELPGSLDELRGNGRPDGDFDAPKSRDDVGKNAPSSRDDVGDNLRDAIEEDDDELSNAAKGAVAGAVVGRRREKKSQEAAAAAAPAPSAQPAAAPADTEGLKKALSVCLEAKGYSVG